MLQTGTWTFAQSFCVFLILVFLSETISTVLKGYIPMPLLFGLFFLAGFSAGWLPRDLLVTANMVTVGTIAFNVLVIHSGTMINVRMLAKQKKETLLAILSAVIMMAAALIILPLLIGKELAFLAPGAVIGGGASCAVGSRWVGMKHPEISFFPWMIFMLQGIISVPVTSWALKKEAHLPGNRTLPPAAKNTGVPGKGPLFARIPAKYKTSSYYLGMIMILAVINYTLQGTVLKDLGINQNITALLLGMLFGNLGIVDPAPLFKADSYGLLILSLMGLMANTIAQSAPAAVISMMLPALIALIVGGAVLLACGYLLSRGLHLSVYTGIIITMNSIMGFPVNRMLAAEAVKDLDASEKAGMEQYLLSVLNLGTALVSNGISIVMISVLVELI